MSTYKMKDLPDHERPRERMVSNGPGGLSNAELLAIVLTSGTREETAVELAAALLAEHGSLEKVATASVGELMSRKGVGHAKACQIAAAFELGRRVASHRDGRRPAINSPEALVEIVQAEMGSLNHEIFRVAMLNSKNELLRVVTVSEGTLSGSLVHPRETFRSAIVEGCYSVILLHNHPSGDPEPSGEDIKVTRQLVEAGRTLGINVLDHIIIARNCFKSLKDAGVIS